MVMLRRMPPWRQWPRLFLLALGLVLDACGVPSAGGTQPAAGVAVERDIPYAEGPRHRLDLYRPEAAGRRPLVLFFHGGFWQMGGKDSLENQVLASGLAARGAVVLVANYRLYPETRFPGFLEDAAAAVAWARRNAERLGATPEGIFVAGHSAGAYIAMMLALDGQWLVGQGLRPRDLAGAIGIAGPYLGDFPRHWTVRGVFAGQPDLAALLPGSFATAAAPPLLLLGGGMDAVVEARHLRGLAERVAGAGGRVEAHVYPGVGHLGLLMSLPWLPGTAPVAEDIMRFALRQRRPPGILQAATGP